ncbi:MULTISPECIES: hypothetical protein [unclassified Thioalkalivibrio]|uniref:hypothetical protein n=1 Tax=unclassified Thioalkalivibrio TaxID=2621013 RepID=UPI00037B83B8|nr:MULTISPECIES: hypothetical protein [unclassified Thioalkalivibrio]
MSIPVINAQAVTIPVRYEDSWQDGFGARGWKLDVAGLGADVIAATPYCGDRIPTSVFVHDIVDHLLCGFSLSGYVDEAAALIQLSLRTHSDPVPDYQQMVDEDLIPGLGQHDDWVELLPASLNVSPESVGDPGLLLNELRDKLGDGALRALLTAGFVREGWKRAEDARHYWEGLGLRYPDRGATALALQELFEWMDATVREQLWMHATGQFLIHREHVTFRFSRPEGAGHRSVNVASGH